MMQRQFHIRVEDRHHRQVDCLVYDNLADANAAYNAMLWEDTEGERYHLELVEVLRLNVVCHGEPPGFDWVYFAKGDGHVV